VAYSFLLNTWKPSVRYACGGVSITDVPDELLDDDLYAVESEDFIKAKIPTWSTLILTYAKEFKRAAICHVAGKVCEYLIRKLNQSEGHGSGDFQFQRQQLKLEELAARNLNQCYQNLELAKPGTMLTLTVIDVVSHTPEVYEEIAIVDEEFD
jgi:hypothetical protein